MGYILRKQNQINKKSQKKKPLTFQYFFPAAKNHNDFYSFIKI